AYKSDLIIVAPATCDFIAHLANGFADNLLLQTILSCKGPLLLAPAMETNMWEHPATQANIKTLQNRQTHIVGPESGDLASGRLGVGRMASPETILEHINWALSPKDFQSVRAVVTAGPTQEDIDPVRYISNYSSGKMGIEIARALSYRGAEVHFVHGSLTVPIPNLPGLKSYPVKTAQNMFDTVLRLSDNADLGILCAAVADFKPEMCSNQKIKKTAADKLSLSLTKNPDILATLGHGSKKPYLVGFAAETDNLVVFAQRKCLEKQADLICANLISPAQNPFGADENQLTIVDSNGVVAKSEKKNKSEIAHFILDNISLKSVF
ncbi:MAG: bifunctional phosphopantothenoylcysteine decarboxylase/phosphopantothenate--cysteine ligase CoaBC, partial [bacterium]|nr:bifunctional phosphopantothenoylcysteine decarboxylase/phosphopantothenate--cysteine ligase CoaBC [bacterium]